MSDNTIQYSPQKLKEFENIIRGKLQPIEEELLSIKQNQKARKEQVVNTNTGFSENSKHFQQQAKNQQLIRRLQRKSRNLRAALKRIDEGTYGVCTRSGKLIREERLVAMPTALFDINRK